MKMRLDLLLVARGFFSSRERARRSIMAGEVLVNGERLDKPGMKVSDEVEIAVQRAGRSYVSRGGVKLEKALEDFGIDVTGKIAIDVGASTGGFVDCLLKKGARKVYAIDVGYGQLAWELRGDPRVVVMERTNIRYVEPDRFGEKAGIATIDVSFISIRKFLQHLTTLLLPGADIVSLIKPQFEAGRGKIGKKGVVRDPEIHIEVLRSLVGFALDSGLAVRNITFSPIKGPEGNIEYFIHMVSPALEASEPPGGEMVKPRDTRLEGCYEKARWWEEKIRKVVAEAHSVL